jgi:hypothetical protein
MKSQYIVPIEVKMRIADWNLSTLMHQVRISPIPFPIIKKISLIWKQTAVSGSHPLPASLPITSDYRKYSSTDYPGLSQRNKVSKSSHFSLVSSVIISLSMAIKNYTSDIPINRIFQRIQDNLAQHGARQISFDYGDDGKVNGVFFSISLKEKTVVPGF